MAVIDLSKAFDTVPYRRLLGKLSHYRINGPISRRIEAFLEDREQVVVVEGRRSPSERILSGVPQGTVLGPVLFIIHINDQPSVVHSQVSLFALSHLSTHIPCRRLVCSSQGLVVTEDIGGGGGGRGDFGGGDLGAIHGAIKINARGWVGGALRGDTWGYKDQC